MTTDRDTARRPGPGGDWMDVIPGRFQASHLAAKDAARQLDRDLLARLTRRPMTTVALASATFRGRSTVLRALRRLEAAGQVQTTERAAQTDRAVWSLVEGADDGPAE